MEKTKKKKINIFGLQLMDLVSLGSTLFALFLGWQSLDNRFESMDNRFERTDRRLDSINFKLNKIETDVAQISTLLNSYLTWQFLYLHDPSRRNIEPRYDPNERTLEFFDKSSTKGK